MFIENLILKSKFVFFNVILIFATSSCTQVLINTLDSIGQLNTTRSIEQSGTRYVGPYTLNIGVNIEQEIYVENDGAFTFEIYHHGTTALPHISKGNVNLQTGEITGEITLGGVSVGKLGGKINLYGYDSFIQYDLQQYNGTFYLRHYVSPYVGKYILNVGGINEQEIIINTDGSFTFQISHSEKIASPHIIIGNVNLDTRAITGTVTLDGINIGTLGGEIEPNGYNGFIQYNLQQYNNIFYLRR